MKTATAWATPATSWFACSPTSAIACWPAASTAPPWPSPRWSITPPPPPATCTYSFKRDYVQAISGEGGLDPALELDGYVKTRVVTPSGSTYSNTYTNSNMKAGTTNNSDVVLTTQSVTSGTVVTLNWDAEVRERDTTSADDIGADGEGLTFTCSSTGSVAYGSVVIDVGGSVGVGVKVTW